MEKITRRAAIAGAGLAALARPAVAQANKQVSILTWNIPNAQPLMDQWIKDFTASRPGVEVEWLDKKGPDLPAFYQTQLVAGTPPDIDRPARRAWGRICGPGRVGRPDALSAAAART